MDGTPVFNLVAALPARGPHRSPSAARSTAPRNLVLSRMEEGLTASAAVKEAQRLGIAEADPRNDLDGWDAAVKGCALANALMGASVRPQQVRRARDHGPHGARRAARGCAPGRGCGSSCAACGRGGACA